VRKSTYTDMILLSGESLWTNNTPPEPAVRKCGVEWNKYYLLLIYFPDFSSGATRYDWLKCSEFLSGATRYDWLKFFEVSSGTTRYGKQENWTQQKVAHFLLDCDFLYCGLGRGIVGSEGFSQFPSPHSLVCSDKFVPSRSSPLWNEGPTLLILFLGPGIWNFKINCSLIY